MLPAYLDRRAALVIAHPGHELRVYNWLSLVQPSVFVLTDGSGHFGKSRLHRTTDILNSLGAQPGSIYGRFTDAEIYSAILAREVGLFIRLTGELAEALVRDRVEYVVGDAIEGYNPVHDVCRLIINAAVKKACQVGSCIENFDVLLAYRLTDESPEAINFTISVAADEHTLAEKLRVARDYLELAGDVSGVLAEEGPESQRIEYLRSVRADSYHSLFEPPYYEVRGERQVAAGYYKQVIRYLEHIAPIARALNDQVG